MNLKQHNNIQCVIDTEVLYSATTYNNCIIDDHSLLLLTLIKEYHILALDAGEKIKTEYENCLARTGDSYLKQWYHFFINTANKTCTHHGGLNASHLSRLLGLGFSQDDEPFMGVASRTIHNLLIFVQDRHYNQQVCQYAKQNLNVDILRPCQCI